MLIKGKSIFSRLLIGYMFIILLGLGLVGISMSFLVKDYIFNQTTEDMLRKAKQVNTAVQDVSSTKELGGMAEFLGQSFDTDIWLFDYNGKIVSTSTEDDVFVGKSIHQSIVQKVIKGENVINELEIKELNEPMLSVVVPWGKEDNIYGGIVLHAPVTGLNETIGNIREMILWALLFGVVLTTVMVSYLSWSISKPLHTIERTATEIGSGNYDIQIDVTTEDEIGDLGATINKMVEKIKKGEHERQRQEQLRTDFLANVSHELRTPLTTIQGFLEALQDGLIAKDSEKKYYDLMYHETKHMNQLVNDIMDLIRLENNEVSISKHPIDVDSIVEKVSLAFKYEAAQKNNTINTDIKDKRLQAYADPNRLEQILNNLVKNAIKFTRNGEINISVQADGGYVLFTISDTGIGISKNDQALVWERFFKVDRGRSRKDNGTGLGLAIVKELVKVHEGDITVSSEVDKGTTFKMWIPERQCDC